MEQARNLIKVINNFITKDEVSRIISFMDNNLDNFLIYQDGTRYVWRFGTDYLWTKETEKTLHNFGELELFFKNFVFPKVESYIDEIYNNSSIAVSTLWLSKHYPGANVPLHEDTDNGHNPQFEYSAVLYLNSLKNTGTLQFPFINFEYSPVAGDLVIFPANLGKPFAHKVEEISEIRYTVPMWMASKEYSFYHS
jgi:hypothetical protein